MRQHTQTLISGVKTAGVTSEVFYASYAPIVSYQLVYDVQSPAAMEFAAAAVDADENTLTKEAHGFATGLKVAATTDGTLPAPLSATNYYVIVVDADTIKLATSYANAVAGTAVNISNTGSEGATHTLTPASLSGASLVVQATLDGTNWTNVATATSISGDGSVIASLSNVAYLAYRAVFALTAGQVDVTVNIAANME